MTFTISAQTIISAAALIAAAIAIILYFVKAVHWFDAQKKQSKDIKELQTRHEEDMKAVRKEQAIVVYGLLACLKGLQEKGCNGPVTEAVDKLEKYLNQKAHED